MADHLKVVRDFQHRRQAMWPFWGIVALARLRSVELHDSRRIEHLLVDLDVSRVEAVGKSSENALDEISIIGWKIDPVEEVVAIPRVSKHRFRPSMLAKLIPDLRGQFEGLLSLLVG